MVLKQRNCRLFGNFKGHFVQNDQTKQDSISTRGQAFTIQQRRNQRLGFQQWENEVMIEPDSDKDLVHDAWLEVMSDPEKYSEFYIQLAEDLEFKFKMGEQKTLSEKQRKQILRILEA